MTFVVIACFIARRSPRDALFGITFFGVCALSAGYNIFRKLRRRRFTATSVAAPGGVKLRGSNSRSLLLATMIAMPGAAIFFVEAPLLIRICGSIMLGASAMLFVLVLSGRVSRRFLRFDPLGITFGEPGFEFTVPWDELSDIAECEMHDNPVVGFDVLQPELIQVTPESARARVDKLLSKNKRWVGRDVVIMPTHFAATAESLCAALLNYAGNRAARADLIPKPALT